MEAPYKWNPKKIIQYALFRNYQLGGYATTEMILKEIDQNPYEFIEGGNEDWQPTHRAQSVTHPTHTQIIPPEDIVSHAVRSFGKTKRQNQSRMTLTRFR